MFTSASRHHLHRCSVCCFLWCNTGVYDDRGGIDCRLGVRSRVAGSSLELLPITVSPGACWRRALALANARLLVEEVEAAVLHARGPVLPVTPSSVYCKCKGQTLNVFGDCKH